MMTVDPQMLGQGLSFPLRVDPSGRLARSAGEENIREAIRVLLLTEPSERLMRENFGCGLRQFLYEPNTPTTRQQIHDRIVNAISRWEPRVTVQNVTVDPDPVDPLLVAVSVTFLLVATQGIGQVDMTLQLEG